MTKHREIFKTLLREIEMGRYAPSDRLPTEQALAERFNTSRPTVSRALQELVRMGLIRRRAGLGTFIRRGSDNARMVFGLLVPELGDSEIFEPICGHIARILQRHGHALQWADTSPSSSRHRQAVETAAHACSGLITQGVAGVFLGPFVTPPETENPNQAIVQTLRRSEIPIVLLDRDMESFPDRSDLDLVAVDHLRGQARMTAFLIEQGYRRLGFWLWANAANTVQQRSAGILRMAMTAGITLDPEFIQICDPDDADAVSRLLRMFRPDAIMCANDIFAARLIKTLEKIGVHVPGDVAVAGYDDVRYANLLQVPLTTISQPCEQIGRAAAQLMLERIAQPDLPPREVLVAPSLAVRDSTATVDFAV